MHYVYIIYSSSKDIYYKGYSLDPQKRLVAHNNNESSFTANKGPWKLVCLLNFDSKKEALIKEKKLKKYSRASLISLINSRQNCFGVG